MSRLTYRENLLHAYGNSVRAGQYCVYFPLTPVSSTGQALTLSPRRGNRSGLIFTRFRALYPLLGERECPCLKVGLCKGLRRERGLSRPGVGYAKLSSRERGLSPCSGGYAMLFATGEGLLRVARYLEGHCVQSLNCRQLPICLPNGVPLRRCGCSTRDAPGAAAAPVRDSLQKRCGCAAANGCL